MPRMTSRNSQTQRLGRQRDGPLRQLGPPRPVPLPERPPRGKLKPDSTYDWRAIGEQVISAALMPPFLYRCPTTGMNVQGWIADDPTEGHDETFESVQCAICSQLHLVNPKTGKVLGVDED